MLMLISVDKTRNRFISNRPLFRQRSVSLSFLFPPNVKHDVLLFILRTNPLRKICCRVGTYHTYIIYYSKRSPVHTYALPAPCASIQPSHQQLWPTSSMLPLNPNRPLPPAAGTSSSSCPDREKSVSPSSSLLTLNHRRSASCATSPPTFYPVRRRCAT